MRARLNDVAVPHGNDEVGARDGREPVCHDEARAPLHEALERGLHLGLGSGVDVRGGLVEDEHGGVCEHGAGNAQQLPLSGRDRGILPSQARVIALGQPLDEVVGERVFRGIMYLLVRGVWAPEHEVLANGGALHPRVLKDHAVGPAQALPRDRSDVVAVHLDGSRVHVVEAHEEVDDGRLAAARGAHDGNPHAWPDVKREVLDEGMVLHVREAHVVERHRARDGRHLDGIGRVGLLLGLVEQLEEPCCAGKRVLELGDDLRDVVEGLRVLVCVAEKRREPAYRERAVDGGERSEDPDSGIDEGVHEARGGVDER